MTDVLGVHFHQDTVWVGLWRPWDRRTYVPDIQLMTSPELTFGFDFWSWGHLRMAVICIYPPSLVQTRRSNSELLTFSEIKHGARRRRHLVFSSYVNLAFRCVNSVILELCTKFSLNICYSHWDRRTYAPDGHLMTSRELASGFDYWSRGHLRMAVMHHSTKFGALTHSLLRLTSWGS